MFSKLRIFQLLIWIAFPSLCTGHITNAMNDDVCGPLVHCDASAGLVCGENNRCTCSSGPLTRDHSYNLQWDSARQHCVGQLGSACVGTTRNPVPVGQKTVPCMDDLSCIQLKGMQNGLGVCQLVPKLQSNGSSCDKDSYCDASKSLICIGGLCLCAQERPNTLPKYQLVWDDSVDNCVGALGSGCIGTKEVGVGEGGKSVGCVAEGECVAVTGQTPGVGICERRTEDGTTTLTPASTINDGSTTSAPGSTTSATGSTPLDNGAGGMLSSQLIVSILVVPTIAFWSCL